MKPSTFEYVAPTSIAETVSLLSEHGYDAKILAGGQSLMPVLNMRLAQPATLIDINGVEGISNVDVTGDHLSIGTLVRQQQLVDDPEIARACPLLADAARHVAHQTIRNRGTVGGSLVHSDPASELPAIMVALDAEMVVHGPNGEKQIPARDFFQDYMTTTLGPEELLVAVNIPRKINDGAGWAFYEVSRRHGDFAIVAVAALVSLDESRAFSRIRLVVTGVGPTPHLVSTDEFIGQESGDVSISAIAKKAAQEIDPPADIQGTAEYRRHLARVLSKKAIRTALDRNQTRTS